MRARTILIPVCVTLAGLLATAGAASAATPRPTGLTATPASSTSITLRWADKSTNERGFEIQRSPANTSTFTQIATTAANATTYTNTGLPPATGYKYRVRALKPPTGFTSFSNVATATTLGGTTTTTTTTTTSTTTTTTPGATVPTPGAFTANATSCAFAAASWNPIFDPNGTYGITKYNLYRNNVVVKTVNAPATTVVDTGLAPLTTYSYAVTAVNAANHESAKSALVSTTTIACPPAGASAKTIGGTGSEYANSVAVDPAGNTVIAGTFRNAANFGNGAVTASPVGDMFVAKYSPAGALLWVNTYPSQTYLNEMNSVATDAAGNVFVAGAFFGTLNLGGGPLGNGQAGKRDAFVAKYSSTGVHQWSHRFGGIIDDAANDVAVDSDGNPVFTGFFKGAGINFAGKPLSSGIFGGYDAFVVKLSSLTGASSLAFATPCGSLVGDGIAIGPNNEIVITGALSVSCNFGGGFVTQNNTDIFVAKYTASGAFVWAKSFGNQFQDFGRAVAVDADGNVIINGSFSSAVNFGNGLLGQAGGWASWGFVAKFTASGAPVWSKAFGNSNATYGNGVAVDAQGNVTIVGSFQDTINLGGGPLTGPMTGAVWGFAAYVAQYSATGVHLASNRYGETGSTQGFDVVATPTGAVATGAFSQTIDLGFGPATSAGGNDMYILRTGR